MENSLFSGLVLLKRPPENLLFLGAMLVHEIRATTRVVPLSVVHDATQAVLMPKIHKDVCFLCCCQKSQ